MEFTCRNTITLHNIGLEHVITQFFCCCACGCQMLCYMPRVTNTHTVCVQYFLFCSTSCVSLRHHSHTGEWHSSNGHMDVPDTEWCKGVPQLCGQCHKWRKRGSQSLHPLHQCGGWGTDAPHRVQHHCAGPHSRRDQGGTSQCTRWDRDVSVHDAHRCTHNTTFLCSAVCTCLKLAWLDTTLLCQTEGTWILTLRQHT